MLLISSATIVTSFPINLVIAAKESAADNNILRAGMGVAESYTVLIWVLRGHNVYSTFPVVWVTVMMDVHSLRLTPIYKHVCSNIPEHVLPLDQAISKLCHKFFHSLLISTQS